ncbi:MAG: malate dehydrogenase, partial [Phycisphaerae bacterium]|nr:malate dehydrogenase [Phycisphaerae bacterium]
AKAGGGEVVKLMGTSAYYAPASGSVQMAEAIIKDKKRILPCAAYCEGEFGIDGMFVGVPAVLGKNGVERVVQIDLNASEQALMDESASHVADLVNTVKTTFPELA